MKRFLGNRSTPALVVSIIALVAAASGTALATSSATPADGLATHGDTATALAGARITCPSGVCSLTNFFNGMGGAPTVTHTAGSGVFDISFPGLGAKLATSVLEVTPDTPSANCTAVNADYLGSGSTTQVVVETKDCNGTFSDRGFHLIAYANGA
jgi:hypothetical protein